MNYPKEDGEEGKENGSVNVGTGEGELDVLGFAPCDAHVREGDDEKEGPQPGERHVENHVMLSSFDGRHLLEKPAMKIIQHGDPELFNVQLYHSPTKNPIEARKATIPTIVEK